MIADAELSGRELDAAVARRVMRLKVRRHTTRTYGDGGAAESLVTYFVRGEGREREMLPRYSEHPRAAGFVEDQIDRLGERARHAYAVALSMAVMSEEGWQSWADTWAVIRATPEQRCRAALAAVAALESPAR